MNHPDQIRRIVKTAPDRPCVVDGARTLTFGEVNERADRAADAWLSAGLHRGDRVAVLAHNEVEYLEWQVAAQRSGLVLVPLNTRLQQPELLRIVSDAEPALLVHGPDFESSAKALGLPRVWHLGSAGAGEPYEDRLAAAAPIPRPIDSSESLATLLYTSGTTGTAKGAMISNRALLARSLSVAAELRLAGGDVFLQGLPMFHLAQTFSCAFAMVGATNVMLRNFEPGPALSAIARHRVTHMLVVPTILRMLLSHQCLGSTDRASLRSVLYGAAPIAQSELVSAMEELDCSFYQMYGMTETGPATLLRPAQHDPGHPELLTSVGSELVGFEVEVRDASGRLAESGQQGEVVIRGPGLMDGYWQAPSATAEALRGEAMHTGDLGYLDNSGLLHLTDRLKDMIITGGENVVPIEVESLLLRHPCIADCAVVGVPDPHYGQRVHAVLVPEPGAGIPGVNVLEQLCRDQLAGYKAPRSWSMRRSLPRTATGKIQRHLLRNSLGEPLTEITDGVSND